MDPNIAVNEVDFTYIAQVIIILAFFAVLILSIILFSAFYICDGHKCDSYVHAKQVGEPGSKEYTLKLLETLGGDGIWPIAFVSSTISTGIVLLILEIPLTIRVFAIIFLITFLSFYAIMSFVAHHYLEIIKTTLADYIINSTPGTPNFNNENKSDGSNNSNNTNNSAPSNNLNNLNNPNSSNDQNNNSILNNLKPNGIPICETYTWKNQIIT